MDVNNYPQLDWPMPPSAINDLARKFMASQGLKRFAAAQIKARGNLAKAKKPRKKYGPLMTIFIRSDKAVRF